MTGRVFTMLLPPSTVYLNGAVFVFTRSNRESTTPAVPAFVSVNVTPVGAGLSETRKV